MARGRARSRRSGDDLRDVLAPPPGKPRTPPYSYVTGHVTPDLVPRRGRSTVPYTEPGPTMHENFRVLQEEAEGAYELLGELAPILGNIAASAFPEPGRALDALNRVHAHLKTYEERYRKQGGGR